MSGRPGPQSMTGQLAVTGVTPKADELDSASLLTATEVAPREGAAGPRFQIPLKTQSLLFGRELDDHHQGPRAVVHGVPARTVVVPLQPMADVARHADVVMRRVSGAPKDVHEALADAEHAGV